MSNLKSYKGIQQVWQGLWDKIKRRAIMAHERIRSICMLSVLEDEKQDNSSIRHHRNRNCKENHIHCLDLWPWMDSFVRRFIQRRGRFWKKLEVTARNLRLHTAQSYKDKRRFKDNKEKKNISRKIFLRYWLFVCFTMVNSRFIWM